MDIRSKELSFVDICLIDACSGCGEEVVTQFTPIDWKMIFDGETVSLNPSIGNWTLDCRSHYVIKRGRVIEAGPWTEEQVAAERLRDRKAKSRHYANQPVESWKPNSTFGSKHEPERKKHLEADLAFFLVRQRPSNDFEGHKV